MYKTLTVPADNETTAEKEVNKLLKTLGLFTWQIKGFGPVHDKETEYISDTPQYKVIVLLTADQADGIKTVIVDQAKKPAPKKPAEKKPAVLAKKPADPVKDKPVK